MAEMIIEESARAVEILVVFTLNLLFILSSTLFLDIKQSDIKVFFDTVSLIRKCHVIVIGNFKQSKRSALNSTKPEVFMIFSKG